MESHIRFGSRLLVPFGIYNQPRLAYVIDQYDTLEGLDGNKKILTVLSDTGEFSSSQFRFLQFISIYFFIPISLVLKVAGFFSTISKPLVYYSINSLDESKLASFRAEERIRKYLKLHPEGFLAKDIRRYLGIKKTSVIPLKLEKLGILKKNYLPTTIQLNNEETKRGMGGLTLCNGLVFEDRLEVYKNLLEQDIDNNYLMISPNQRSREKMETYFLLAGFKNITFGSKFTLLSLKKTFDIILIDDYTNSEYRFSKPIAFDIEKVAKIRSMELNTKIILGSFLPSISSYKDLRNGNIKHQKQVISKSNNKPLLIIRSLPKEIEKHGFSYVPFSIQNEIKKNIATNKKSLLVLNRKGFFNLLACKECGFTVKCSLCGIPLSYHPENKKLVCQYCGKIVPEYEKCPVCENVSLHFAVCGTEKIEKEIKRIFPNEKIIRIDSNSTQLIRTESHDFSIAIGTSLVLSMLDFESIDLCCILGIDSMLNYPHYKSQENTFHYIGGFFEKMMSKKNYQKRIIVPTYTPYGEIFRQIQSGSLRSFYQTELNNREELKYPPFVDLVKISMESKNKEELPPVVMRLQKALQTIEGLEIISTKPLLKTSPFGVYSAEILIRSNEILNSQDQIAVMIDEFKKNEKINMLIRNME